MLSMGSIATLDNYRGPQSAKIALACDGVVCFDFESANSLGGSKKANVGLRLWNFCILEGQMRVCRR
jgi:hypothetical protein